MSSTTSGHHGQSERADTVPREVDADSFRALMSGHPSGVAVVTTIDARGVPRGLTCTSVCSVGLEPPSLLVCLDNRSGTLRALSESGVFAVNLLHTRGRGAAQTFATAGPDRFSEVAWEPTERHAVPRLTDDARAVAECRVLHTLPAGDHTVVVGAVEDVVFRPRARPLLYGERRYAGWPRPPEDSGTVGG
ncbi:flavin reductase family protein [Streptomyces nanhaiensis]|uniref:flavin reductase family protein n=1 Tax=Streptomyces nanhaiensis TaxID=679319 RepID=UPI00399CA39F